MKQTLTDFKEKLMTSLDQWIDVRIDDFADAHPNLNLASIYMKRGAKNYLKREGERIDEMIDSVSLFLLDENGHIDSDLVLGDVLTLFKQMEEQPFHLGFVEGSIGKGTVRFQLPDNPLIALFFGDNSAIRLTADDFEELVEAMKTK